VIPRARRPHEVRRSDYSYARPYEPITDQSGKARVDINNVIATYHRTGVLPGFAQKRATYGECPSMDFNEAVCMAAEASQQSELEALHQEFKKTPPEASEEVSEIDSAEAETEASEIDSGEMSQESKKQVPELTNEGT
jgi:hypothetical protein